MEKTLMGGERWRPHSMDIIHNEEKERNLKKESMRDCLPQGYRTGLLCEVSSTQVYPPLAPHPHQSPEISVFGSNEVRQLAHDSYKQHKFPASPSVRLQHTVDDVLLQRHAKEGPAGG